jgi:hypothetical protein
MINFHRENQKPNINRVCDRKVAGVFCMADLGCTMGINTLLSVDTIVRAVKIAFNHHSMDVPEFQVYFVDLPSNDFNTLLRTLPPRLVDDMTEGDGKIVAALDEDNPPASRSYFVAAVSDHITDHSSHDKPSSSAIPPSACSGFRKFLLASRREVLLLGTAGVFIYPTMWWEIPISTNSDRTSWISWEPEKKK